MCFNKCVAEKPIDKKSQEESKGTSNLSKEVIEVNLVEDTTKFESDKKRTQLIVLPEKSNSKDLNASFWSNLTVELLGSLAGFLLGILIAIGAYFLQRCYEQKELLGYFQSLLNNVIIGLDKDIVSIDAFTNKIGLTPHILPLLVQRPNYDIKRICERISQETYYIAYLAKGGSKDEFRKLFSHLDFYNEVIVRIEDQVDKALGFDHNRKVLIKQIVFDIQMQLEYLDITGQEGNLKTLLDAKRLAGTFAYPTGDDVKTWVDNFLLPFKETLIQNHLSRTEPFKS